MVHPLVHHTYSELLSGQHTYSEIPRVAAILRTIGLLGLAGLALCIAGGVLATTEGANQDVATALRRAGVCVYAGVFAILIAVHIGTWTYRWHLRSYRRSVSSFSLLPTPDSVAPMLILSFHSSCSVLPRHSRFWVPGLLTVSSLLGLPQISSALIYHLTPIFTNLIPSMAIGYSTSSLDPLWNMSPFCYTCSQAWFSLRNITITSN